MGNILWYGINDIFALKYLSIMYSFLSFCQI